MGTEFIYVEKAYNRKLLSGVRYVVNQLLSAPVLPQFPKFGSCTIEMKWRSIRESEKITCVLSLSLLISTLSMCSAIGSTDHKTSRKNVQEIAFIE